MDKATNEIKKRANGKIRGIILLISNNNLTTIIIIIIITIMRHSKYKLYHTIYLADHSVYV